jgi:hypothetical protein
MIFDDMTSHRIQLIDQIKSVAHHLSENIYVHTHTHSFKLYLPLLWPGFDCFGGVEAVPERRVKKTKFNFHFGQIGNENYGKGLVGYSPLPFFFTRNDAFIS